MLRTSAIFSVLLLVITSLTSGIFYKISKDNEKRDAIRKQLNSIDNVIRQSNYPILARNIQQDLALQELTLTDTDCNILATTSLTFKNRNCIESNKKLSLFKTSIGEKNILIFYKDDFSFIETFKKNTYPLIILALCFFLITFLCLWYFLYKTFTVPINKIRTAINQDLDSYIPNEFDFIGKKLIELKSEIEKKKGEKIYFQLARRVVHDIRNPLSVLKNSLASNEGISLQKVCEIEYQIQSLLGLKDSSIHRFDTKFLQNDLDEDFKVFYPMKLTIQSAELTTNIQTHINYFDLKNVLLNLARNSFESNSRNFIIELMTTKQCLRISVTDDGDGIDNKISNKIFEETFSTKEDGFGIGLSSLKCIIEKAGGKISLDPNYKLGARFILDIPIVCIVKDKLILIDDDKYIHNAWATSAKEKDIILFSFRSVKEFLEQSESFQTSIPVFIDSSLGEPESGEELSRKIHDIGFNEIYLATGFSNPDISNYPWIKSAIDKSPPF